MQQSPNDVQEIRSELADVVIFAATLANCFSFSLEEDITNKLSRNFHKYNPEVAKTLKKQGLSSLQVLENLKKSWNRDDDKGFMK